MNEQLAEISRKYGWDEETLLAKIAMTKEILRLASDEAAIDFLLATKVTTICDGCNVRPLFEHRCHDDCIVVAGVQTERKCECPFCFVSRNLVT